MPPWGADPRVPSDRPSLLRRLLHGLAPAGRQEGLELLLDHLRLVAALDRGDALDHDLAQERFLLLALVELRGERQEDDVRQERAVERRQERDRHTATDLRRIGEVLEHGHQTDERSDHAERRRDLAHLVEDGLADADHVPRLFEQLFHGPAVASAVGAFVARCRQDVRFVNLGHARLAHGVQIAANRIDRVALASTGFACFDRLDGLGRG